METHQDQRLRDLMRAAQTSDRAAYETLLRELAPLVRAHIRRQRPFFSETDIEDLVQDVLLSLHAVRHTYDPARPFRPWLNAIVHHRLADRGRRDARRQAAASAAQELHETFGASDANTEEGEYGDPEALRQAVARLPEKQRRAIEAVKLGDKPLKEAAAETGMSVAALKVSVHRGVKTLRRLLKKEIN